MSRTGYYNLVSMFRNFKTGLSTHLFVFPHLSLLGVYIYSNFGSLAPHFHVVSNLNDISLFLLSHSPFTINHFIVSSGIQSCEVTLNNELWYFLYAASIPPPLPKTVHYVVTTKRLPSYYFLNSSSLLNLVFYVCIYAILNLYLHVL